MIVTVLLLIVLPSITLLIPLLLPGYIGVLLVYYVMGPIVNLPRFVVVIPTRWLPLLQLLQFVAGPHCLYCLAVSCEERFCRC